MKSYINVLADYRDAPVEWDVALEKEAVQEKVQEIIDYVLDHSDWEFDEEEIQELYQDYLKKMNTEEICGKSYEELTDEDLQENFEVASREELEKFMKAGVEQEIAFVLWGASEQGRNASEIDISKEEDMDYDFTFLEEYVKSRLRVENDDF